MTGSKLRFLADESCDFAVVRTVEEQGENLAGSFVVVQPGYIRISQKP